MKKQIVFCLVLILGSTLSLSAGLGRTNFTFKNYTKSAVIKVRNDHWTETIKPGEEKIVAWAYPNRAKIKHQSADYFSHKFQPILLTVPGYAAFYAKAAAIGKALEAIDELWRSEETLYISVNGSPEIPVTATAFYTGVGISTAAGISGVPAKVGQVELEVKNNEKWLGYFDANIIARDL